jgi:penicillin-binding protein 1A
MKAASVAYPGEIIRSPPNAEIIEVCNRSGLRATDNCYEPVPDDTGRLRFVRTTYPEVVRPGYRVSQTCDFHSKRREGDLPLETPSLASGPSPIIDPKAAAAAASAAPVVVMSPVVLGNFDPYQSLKAAFRVPKATPVDSEILPQSIDSRIHEKSVNNSIDREPGRVSLKPPPPVKIE